MIAVGKWVAPPGYRVLADVVQEYGRDLAQAKLLSGQWPAFDLNLTTGDLMPIPATVWCVVRGHMWLDKAVRGDSTWIRSIRGVGIRWGIIVQVTERQSPLDDPEAADGPAVRFAKELMDAVYPKGKWRQMKIRAVRKGCEKEAERRKKPLPSPDTFSRAMDRRGK